MPRIGVIGDVHGQFDEEDARLLDEAGYDLLLFVGDFASYRQVEGERVAEAIHELRTPAIAIPGNHDGVTALQMLSEILPQARPARGVLSWGQEARCERISRALGGVPCEGYRLFRLPELGLQVLTGRPHSFGGAQLASARYLRDHYGVGSMEESARLLRERLREAEPSLPLIFLAHNGPTGLGALRDSIYGCDFREEGGDFGDPDLREALDAARGAGLSVPAVVAGHMHHAIKGGGERRWQLREGSTLHVNAACVPRHRKTPTGSEAHHVRLVLEGGEARAEAVFSPRGAAPRRSRFSLSP